MEVTGLLEGSLIKKQAGMKKSLLKPNHILIFNNDQRQFYLEIEDYYLDRLLGASIRRRGQVTLFCTIC